MPDVLPKGSTILVIGSGPIIIGQAAEFDYSGTQACKVLRSMGYRVVLLNSNPATIMTDPGVADVTYIEPISVQTACSILAEERPDAVLPTVGGQVGLNLALELHRTGALERYGTRLIGAQPDAIDLAEDRQRFKEAMVEIGVGVAESGIAHSLEEALSVLEGIGLPAIIRPSFTLGGAGGGIAHDRETFIKIVENGLSLSPTTQVLVEQSLLGWKEFELEVVRDCADNALVVCAIENLDPMGVHTGDSVTVAPPMTLTDREYQNLRDLSLQILRRVGVETGGSNVQFAIHPSTGDVVVIELNPRVSRSSALASKATGFPIAKIAAQLAVGCTLDTIQNDITRVTPASFEPVLDYVIVKIPQWSDEKFPGIDERLGSVMRSVGEVMGIGRSFAEAVSKAVQSLEGGLADVSSLTDIELEHELRQPTPRRFSSLFEAFRRDWSVEVVHEHTHVDPWFLYEIESLVGLSRPSPWSDDQLLAWKQAGLLDSDIATQQGLDIEKVRQARLDAGVVPTYKRVDTCAGEFEAHTPTLYSSWEEEDEAGSNPAPSVVILGNGPNRIGQGLEFDYCCCHAAWAVKEAGFTSVMVNCNPETVSTDYDTSDKLYFEPIDQEHVQHVMDREQPLGVILQFGGQTPLKLSHTIGPVLGTQPDVIDICEDRQRFSAVLERLSIPQPEHAHVHDEEEARRCASEIGFPLLVRPSYVLGGRAMVNCLNQATFEAAIGPALATAGDHGVLLDRTLHHAIELDVDALSDGTDVFIAGIVEHIEEAGVHSGDSSGVLPPVRCSAKTLATIRSWTQALALDLGVVGLMNIQFAVEGDDVFVLEVNPRASRTVPFVAKATGLPLPALATRLCLGTSLAELDLPEVQLDRYYVKAPVFPWRKFAGANPTPGPEMHSTGEVMGIGSTFGEAMAKALEAAGTPVPTEGAVGVHVSETQEGVDLCVALEHMGFQLHALSDSAAILRSRGLTVAEHATTQSLLDTPDLDMVWMLPLDPAARHPLRDQAVQRGISCFNRLPAIASTLPAIQQLRTGGVRPVRL